MTLVDETYLESCPRCGAVVLRKDQVTHNIWHQTIVDLATATQQINQGLDQSAKVSRQLWEAIETLTRAELGRRGVR